MAMTTDGDLTDHALQVWNRATGGVAASDREGDIALARALRFDGYAAAGSIVSAIEMEIGEGWVGEGRAGFAWFGLDDVVALLDEVSRDYEALNDSGLEGPAHADRWDEIDQAGSDRYAELQVTDTLTSALERLLVERPASFADVGGEPEPSQDWVKTFHQPFARYVSGEEKAALGVQALAAFGISAEAVGPRLVVGDTDEGAKALADEILSLLDGRYPEAPGFQPW